MGKFMNRPNVESELGLSRSYFSKVKCDISKHRSEDLPIWHILGRIDLAHV
jgi:hypothetical protein